MVCEFVLSALCHFDEEEEDEVFVGLDGGKDDFDADVVSPGLLYEVELFVDDCFFWDAFDVASDDDVGVVVFDFF